jgi:hypothetical protein
LVTISALKAQIKTMFMKKRQEIKYAIAVLVFGAVVVLIHFIAAQKSETSLRRITEVQALEILINKVESSTLTLSYEDGDARTFTAEIKKVSQAFESSSEDFSIAARSALQNIS